MPEGPCTEVAVSLDTPDTDNAMIHDPDVSGMIVITDGDFVNAFAEKDRAFLRLAWFVKPLWGSLRPVLAYLHGRRWAVLASEELSDRPFVPTFYDIAEDPDGVLVDSPEALWALLRRRLPDTLATGGSRGASAV